MATFTGGETVVNVVSVNFSGTGTAYTVPAGRYARVVIQGLTLNNTAAVNVGGVGYTNSSGSAQTIWNVGGYNGVAGAAAGNSNEFVLNTGETIVFTGTGTLKLNGLEYNLP